MDLNEIEEKIRHGREAQYHPSPVDPKSIELDSGTRILLTNLKRKLQWTGRPLRRRVARRFSIIGSQHQFGIELDGQSISIEDREYQEKLQFVWTFGQVGLQSRAAAGNLQSWEERSGQIDGYPDLAVDGWIGTAFEAGQLRDSDTKESINKIVIMVRGKLAQEDILEEFGEGGLYTKYMFGEIHADFLDLDNQEDIATTSRQRLIEEDPRYQALKAKLLTELKHIQAKWTELRNRQGKGASGCLSSDQGMVRRFGRGPESRSRAAIWPHQSIAYRRRKRKEATFRERKFLPLRVSSSGICSTGWMKFRPKIWRC